jgi:hypothetical protein
MGRVDALIESPESLVFHEQYVEEIQGDGTGAH